MHEKINWLQLEFIEHPCHTINFKITIQEWGDVAK